MKDDSGISISAMPIWTYDSLYTLENKQIGWIYALHNSVKKEFSADTLTPDLIENAKVLLFGEVDYYNSYLRGECYRFDLYRDGKPVANYTGLLGKAVTCTKSSGAISACSSILPALTTIVSSNRAVSSMKVGNAFFIPIGEHPPCM